MYMIDRQTYIPLYVYMIDGQTYSVRCIRIRIRIVFIGQVSFHIQGIWLRVKWLSMNLLKNIQHNSTTVSRNIHREEWLYTGETVSVNLKQIVQRSEESKECRDKYDLLSISSDCTCSQWQINMICCPSHPTVHVLNGSADMRCVVRA